MHEKIKNFTDDEAQAVYKEILQPRCIRKYSLNLAVDFIKLLEDYERYRKIKNRKYECFGRLGKLMEDLKEDIKKLESKAPFLESMEHEHEIKEKEAGHGPHIAKETKDDRGGDRRGREDANERIMAELNKEAQSIRAKLNSLKL